jgi:hypothetical protein
VRDLLVFEALRDEVQDHGLPVREPPAADAAALAVRGFGGLLQLYVSMAVR